MSASREKKQRRDTDASMLSPRAQEEQQKATRRKRNTILYTIIGVIAVILVAALFIWDSGIIQRHRTVATLNGEKVTAPQILFYYYNNDIYSTAQTYAQYGAQLGMSYPFSTSESPKEQTITEEDNQILGLDEKYVGQTYHEYLLDSALNTLSRQYALLDAAKEAGYSLSDEGKEAVKEGLAALDSNRESYLATYGVNLSRTAYLQLVYGELMSESAYRSILENAQLAQEYYDLAFDTLTGYSDEELDDYYQSNADSLDTVSYYYRIFDGTAESTTDEDGNTVEPTEEETEAALAAAKQEAEDALAAVEEDPDSVQDNDDFQLVTGVLSVPTAFYYEWMTDPNRKPGDATVFEGDYSNYYLVVFGDRYLDETPTVDVRHILVSAMAEDDPDTEDVDESMEDPTDEAYEAAKAKAEEVLDEWKSGDATENSFAELAEKYSADSGSNTNGGLYTQVTEGSMIAGFNDWIFDSARESGDISDPIQNTESSVKGWHLIYFVGQNEPVWKTTARENLWLQNLENTAEIVTNERLEDIFA